MGKAGQRYMKQSVKVVGLQWLLCVLAVEWEQQVFLKSKCPKVLKFSEKSN